MDGLRARRPPVLKTRPKPQGLTFEKDTARAGPTIYDNILYILKVIRMVRRPTPPSNPKRPILTIEQKHRCIDRLNKRINELEAFDPQTIQKRFSPEVLALQNAIADTLSVAFGDGTPEYRRYSSAKRLDDGTATIQFVPAFGGMPEDAQRARQYFIEGKGRSVVLLRQAIRTLEEEIAEEEQSAQPLGKQLVPELSTRKVFVVHGHDEGAREAVARFLEQIGFEPIILHEQANQGRTVIEKVEVHGNVGFAVVLLTPDDEGCQKGGTLQPRARQNVLIELGYFVGRLGREHVCALKRGDVEIPSDFGGVVYETFDASGGWKQALGRELRAIGYEIDWNRVMRP